ncbi:hypothetical protein OVA24_01680 [Luteolibacter sp. SL250]|uniref:hypothetical protein n=1 Tax=Luteolibacter sp. SL250 TaxID=2995170 RepID=UPI00227087BC|nr:hypothetical protein [Luteolibacter sp. SL250]WAC20087.1 hypothetical protein OVA24_01680 [Luteolibacter sp. SL250]
MSNQHNVHIQLNDGKAVIDRWPHDSNQLPTIGDVIAIPSVGGRIPEGYQENATVFRIDRDLNNGELTVILDLQPVSAKGGRLVVFLNTEYVAENLRREVEEHLRGKLEVPAFEWIHSTEPAPVIRIHQGLSEIPHAEVAKLQKGVRAIIEAASPLATV